MATATTEVVETKTVHLSLTLEEAEILKHLLYTRVTNSPEELSAINDALGSAEVLPISRRYIAGGYVNYTKK